MRAVRTAKCPALLGLVRRVSTKARDEARRAEARVRRKERCWGEEVSIGGMVVGVGEDGCGGRRLVKVMVSLVSGVGSVVCKLVEVGDLDIMNNWDM